MIDKEIVRGVLKQATDKQRFLAFSSKSADKLYTISQKYQLSANLHPIFARTICHIILGFYRTEDTVPLLQQELQIDPRTAALLGAEVLDFLSPLSDPNWIVPTEEEEGTEKIETYSEEDKTIISDSSISPEVTTEQNDYKNHVNFTIPASLKPQNIPELRTMATDMRSPQRTDFEPLQTDNTPTYTSSQDSTITPPAPSYNAPLYNTPKPAPLEPPRWGN